MPAVTATHIVAGESPADVATYTFTSGIAEQWEDQVLYVLFLYHSNAAAAPTVTIESFLGDSQWHPLDDIGTLYEVGTVSNATGGNVVKMYLFNVDSFDFNNGMRFTWSATLGRMAWSLEKLNNCYVDPADLSKTVQGAPATGTPNATTSTPLLLERRLHSPENITVSGASINERVGNALSIASGATLFTVSQVTGEELRWGAGYRIDENAGSNAITWNASNTAQMAVITAELRAADADDFDPGIHTTADLYPTTTDGENYNTGANNDAFGRAAPVNATDGHVSWATDTTQRYILLKPGVLSNTAPTQTTSPLAIAAQGFGWVQMRRYISLDPADGYATDPTKKRYFKSGTIAVRINFQYAQTDLTAAYGFVVNIYKRSVTGTFTYLNGAEIAAYAVVIGDVAKTLNVTFDGVVLEYGETIHFEVWLKGKGLAVTGQGCNFRVGTPTGGDPTVFTLPQGVRTQMAKTLTGATTPSGATVRKPVKVLAGASVPSGAISRRAALILSGATTPTGNLGRKPAKSFTGSVTPTGSFIKQPGRVLAGAVTPSGAIVRKPVKMLDGSVTPTGVLNRLITALLSGEITPSGAVVRMPSKFLSGSVTPSGSVLRQFGRTITGTIAPVGAIIRKVFKLLSGSITPSGITSKLTSLGILSGAITPTGALVKKPHIFLEAEIGPTGDCPDPEPASGLQIGHIVAIDLEATDISLTRNTSHEHLRMTRNSQFQFTVEFRDADNVPVDITGATITIDFKLRPWLSTAVFTRTTALGITILDQGTNTGQASVLIVESNTVGLPNRQIPLWFDIDVDLDSVTYTPPTAQQLLVDPEVTP
jgi:hypothetical protein